LNMKGVFLIHHTKSIMTHTWKYLQVVRTPVVPAAVRTDGSKADKPGGDPLPVLLLPAGRFQVSPL
jgi:hypothetical protein